MAARSQRAAAAPRHKNGKVVVVVPVAVANRSAIHNHAVVQQRSFGFLYGFQPVEEIGELLHVEVIDFRDFFLLRGVVLMVRKGVVPIGHADERIRPVVAIVRRDEGGDTRRVALERQRHQVIHQPQMLFILLGHAGRAGKIRLCGGEFFGLLDALLQFADGGEVFVQLMTVGVAELRL